jgi:hypothetical protein
MTALAPVPTRPSTMPLVWHLCRHDLTRFRVLAAAMTGFELLRAAYAEWTLQLAPIAFRSRSGMAEGEAELYMLDVVVWGLTWIVTAIVVQADHPSDDRAFWRTRPIAPASMALAKLVWFALVVVAVPVVINSARLAAYGAPLSAHVAATIQIAVTAGGAVVPAWAFAIATRTLPRFLALVGALLVIGYTGLFATIAFSIRPGAPGLGLGFDLSDWSRSIVLGWLPALALTIAALGVIVAHYRWRRPWAAAAVGAALAVIPGFLPPPNRATAPSPELAALVAAPLRPRAGLSAEGQGDTTAFLSGRLASPALPPDVSAGVFVTRARVWVGGTSVVAGGFQQCCLGVGPLAVASSRPVTPQDGGGWSEEIAVVRADALPDMYAKPVTLDAEATVVFERHRLVASLPLRDGAAFAGDGYLVEIVAARALPRSDALLRISRFPTLSPASRPRLSFFHADPARTQVSPSPSPYVSPSARPAATPVREWAQGRRWAGRYQLMLFGGVSGPDRRLLIVESRRAGETQARIVAAGAPISRARHRPR